MSEDMMQTISRNAQFYAREAYTYAAQCATNLKAMPDEQLKSVVVKVCTVALAVWMFVGPITGIIAGTILLAHLAKAQPAPAPVARDQHSFLMHAPARSMYPIAYPVHAVAAPAAHAARTAPSAPVAA